MRFLRHIIIAMLAAVWGLSYITIGLQSSSPLEWTCLVGLGMSSFIIIGYCIYRTRGQQLLSQKYKILNSILSTMGNNCEIIVFNDKGKTIWTSHPNAYPSVEQFMRKLLLRVTASSELDKLQKLIEKNFSGDVLLSNKGNVSEPRWYSVQVRHLDLSIGFRRRNRIIILNDISNHFKETKVIQQNYNSLQNFVEKLPFGLCHIANNGQIISLNQTLASWCELDKQNMIGSSISDFVKAPLDKEYSMMTITAPGSSVFNAIVYNTNPSGPKQTLLFYKIDKHVGSNLAHGSSKKYSLAESKAAIPGLMMRLDGRITSANPAFFNMLLSNHGPEAERNVMKKKFDELLHPTERSSVMSKLRRCLSSKAPPTPLEMRFHKDDLFTTAYISRLQTDASNDDQPHFMIQFIDISEQKQLERQFIQSQKMQAVGQLAGGIAHDFNNLLTVMIGFCDLLLQRYTPSDPSYSDVMQIKQNANRAANLVRQLLAFSRQQTLQPKVVDITDSLDDLTVLLQRLIGAGIELHMKHGRGLWSVKVDVSQLEQVIINLVVNARDAMGAGGTLRINTYNKSIMSSLRIGHDLIAKGEYVVVEVADNGSGIAQQHLEHIFEPFFSTKEVGSGTGLGLSTVFGIVKQTGGYIQVESVIDRGTTFRIYLPRFQGETAQEIKAKETITGDLTGHGAILLVEDEDAVRAFGARALREKGYNVSEATNGEDALKIIQQQGKLDLLITDVVMPRMDGPTLCKKIKEKSPTLKTIFISGYTEDTFRSSLDEDNSHIHFLQKPFTLKDLAAKVKDVLKDNNTGLQ